MVLTGKVVIGKCSVTNYYVFGEKERVKKLRRMLGQWKEEYLLWVRHWWKTVLLPYKWSLVETPLIWSQIYPGSAVSVSFSTAKFQFLAPWDTAIAIRLTWNAVFKFGVDFPSFAKGDRQYPLGNMGWESKNY